jgi:hypothetical protein
MTGTAHSGRRPGWRSSRRASWTDNRLLHTHICGLRRRPEDPLLPRSASRRANEPGRALAGRGSPFASGKAVGAFDTHTDNQAVITNHGSPIVGPVRVLTLHGTVKLDELLNRLVVRLASHWR